MKKLIVLLCSLTLFVFFSTDLHSVSSSHRPYVTDSIHVWSSPDLIEITTTLVNAYTSLKPEVKMDVITVSDTEFNNILNTSGSIGLITKTHLSALRKSSIWKMVVGRDIVVPITSSKNPYMDDLFKRGVSMQEFSNLFLNPTKQNWGSLLNNDETTPVNCYFMNEELSKSYLAEFFNTDLQNIQGLEVAGIEEMLNEIYTNKYALGFCKLADILDYDKQNFKEGVQPIPIDINGNNKVEYFENIYKTAYEFSRAIWVGKYPKALFSNIYSVAKTQPSSSEELAFLEWIITNGQAYFFASGYSELIFSERQSKVQGLYTNQIAIVDIQKKPMPLLSVLTVLVIALIGGFLIIRVIKYIRSKNLKAETENINIKPVFGEYSLLAPKGLFYDKSHTWAFMEQDGYVRIGIDDFLQHVIGPITRVRMKNQGDNIKKGEPFLSLIQYGKKLEIKSPISGTIKEINERLYSATTLMNSYPYSHGWVYTIESVNWLREIKSLLLGEKYRSWVKNEFSRLKEFLSSVVKSKNPENLQLIMQDGGELNDGVLEHLGPEVWEEFQTNFVNRSK